MKIVATQKNVRQTPRKLRLVANQVKDLPLEKALRQLAAIERRSTIVLLKTIRQAVANAQHNHGINFKDLEIESILIGEAAKYKRFRAASRGRAHSVVKRSSHIRVVLESQSSSAKASEDKKVSPSTSSGTIRNDKKKIKKSKGVAPVKTHRNASVTKKQVGRAVKATRQRTTNK